MSRADVCREFEKRKALERKAAAINAYRLKFLAAASTTSSDGGVR